MSILIKGMEMPKKGSWVSLQINPDGQCFLYSWCGNDFDFMEHLTAVPVPPHGRLIDADLLGKILKKRAEDEWNKNTSPFSWSYAYECLMDTLDIMPTIIEAEDET